MKNSKEKAMYFGRPKINIVGSDEDENKRIWCLEDDGVMFRTAEFDSGLGGETVEILQLTDLHLNCMNIKDLVLLAQGRTESLFVTAIRLKIQFHQ